jgi:hypothetical protein
MAGVTSTLAAIQPLALTWASSSLSSTVLPTPRNPLRIPWVHVADIINPYMNLP